MNKDMNNPVVYAQDLSNILDMRHILSGGSNTVSSLDVLLALLRYPQASDLHFFEGALEILRLMAPINWADASTKTNTKAHMKYEVFILETMYYIAAIILKNKPGLADELFNVMQTLEKNNDMDTISNYEAFHAEYLGIKGKKLAKTNKGMDY